MDQPFWASRVRLQQFSALGPPRRHNGLIDGVFCWPQVAALGAGPQLAIPLKKLTRDNLESQILAASGEGNHEAHGAHAPQHTHHRTRTIAHVPPHEFG
jgi:hypothetical protein